MRPASFTCESVASRHPAILKNCNRIEDDPKINSWRGSLSEKSLRPRSKLRYLQRPLLFSPWQNIARTASDIRDSQIDTLTSADDSPTAHPKNCATDSLIPIAVMSRTIVVSVDVRLISSDNSSQPDSLSLLSSPMLKTETLVLVMTVLAKLKKEASPPSEHSEQPRMFSSFN